jgi:hypothetical protein
VFESLTDIENSDYSDLVGFLKIQKNSVKFRKIRSKHSRDDVGIVVFWNPEFRPVLPNYRATSPINRQLYPKIALAIPKRIVAETG